MGTGCATGGRGGVGLRVGDGGGAIGRLPNAGNRNHTGRGCWLAISKYGIV